MSKYLCNKIRCPVCEEVIQSYHIHDFKFCKCGSVAIDGGNDYLRRISEIVWEELSVLDDGIHETRRNNLAYTIEIKSSDDEEPYKKTILLKDLGTMYINIVLKNSHDPFCLKVFKNELDYRKTL